MILDEPDFVTAASTIESILPVSFTDPELERDYRQVFYPARNVAERAKKKKQLAAKKSMDAAGLDTEIAEEVSGATDRKHYAQLCQYLAEVSGSINSVLALARYIVQNSRDFSIRDPKDVQLLVDQAFRQIKASAATATENAFITFVDSLNSGKNHVIRPSERYKGGFDVLFSGLPAYGGTKGTAVSTTSDLMRSYTVVSGTGGNYKMAKEEGGLYNNVYAEAAIEMAHTLISGEIRTATSMIRKVRNLALDFDFTRIVEGAVNCPKIKALGLVLSSECPKLPAELAISLSKYFSIITIREANHAAVRSAIANPGGDITEVNEEQLILNPVIGLSIAINLPEQIVSFITQTPAGQRIPLMSLNTWVAVWSRALLKAPARKRAKDADVIEQSKVNPGNCPRYVLTASSMKMLNEQRKKLGFFAEEGRTNEDGIYVSNLGTLNFCPKSSEMALDNALGYEKVLEEAIQLSFDAGTPLAASQEGETNPVFGLASPEYKQRIAAVKATLKKYAGAVQSYSWDYNCILTSSASDPEKLQPLSTAGATVPDATALADYLRKPFAESMQLLFPHATSMVSTGKSPAVTQETFGKGSTSCAAMLSTTLFMNLALVYIYLLSEKKVPSFAKLVEEAAKELNIVKLDVNEEWADIERNLYTGVLTNDLHVAPIHGEEAAATEQVGGLYKILGRVLKDAGGAYGSNLARHCSVHNEQIEENEHYFNPEHFTLAEFKNVYSYLGGRVFYKMMQSLASVDKKALMVINPENPLQPPNFAAVVRDAMPLSIILSKYVPNSETIIAQADVLSDGYKKDDSLSLDDIHVPGNTDKMQLFPHQVEAHKFLRNDPRFAVLDIAPGGGKTVTLLSDIAALMNAKKITRPLIICPNSLVRNWIEDLHKITGGKWNAIPVMTEVFNSAYWGDERLTKLISTAPRNTIVVVGLSALKLRPYSIVIGSHAERVSEGLEFMKKFGFDYIAIDECHRVKNVRRATHKVVKQIATASCVKYIRLATGSLISNKLSDVVGQAAMFSSQIFRTAAEFEQEVSDQIGDASVPSMLDAKTPGKLARDRLSKYSAVVTFKRKEWAFMLPLPAEEFIPVTMTKEEAEGGNAHQLMYDAVLKVTMDEIKNDPDIKRLLSGKDDDGTDEGDDGDDDELSNLEDLDDATLAELEAKLQPRLARLEQMLTDPLGDEFGKLFFKNINEENFVSNKVLKVIERIRLSFEDHPWRKGAEYQLRPKQDEDGHITHRSIVDVDDVRYILMPDKNVDFKSPDYYAPYTSIIHPKDDPRWKVEPRGKVLIFCRYNRTTEAIYRALPPDLKKIASTFSGSSGQALEGREKTDKWDNLAAFKNDKWSKTTGAQILIANEQAISEGHNLQMADRLVRVESPWTPGELDQAQSRIFRPDPSAANRREIVYLDWILTNNSMEVAKMGRLISKMIVKAQFDEADNPLYERLNSDDHQLPLIRMSLDMFQAVPNLDDISNYTNTYGLLASIQGREFQEMRATKPSQMFDVPQTPMFEDARILEQVPYIDNLKVPDRHNFGLVPLNAYLSDPDSEYGAELAADPKKLIGMYAHTEIGNGTIVDVRVAKSGDSRHPRISSMKVKLAGSDEMYDAVPAKVYLATNLDENTIKNFQAKPWLSKAEQKRADAEAEREQKRIERQVAAELKALEKEKAELKRLREIELAKKSKKKPAPVVEEEEEVEEENNNLELFPVVYNAQLGLEAAPEDQTIDMTSFKFRDFGSYAATAVKDKKSFDAVLAFLESKFHLASAIRKRLMSLDESFMSGRGRKFDVEQAPMAELRNFYTIAHKPATVDKVSKKAELKIYPVILNETLLLNIDMSTNPAFRKYLGKVVPGTTNMKFEEYSALNIKFFADKRSMMEEIKTLKSEGFVITNEADCKAQIKALKISKS